MRAAVFDEPFALRVTEAAKPAPGPGEALVRVRAAGVCAGDLYIYTGRNPYVSYPRIGCHEIAGVVEAYGEGAAGPPVGSRVVVDPFIGCGRCYPCRIGKRNCCANLTIIGVHREGGFADYVAAPAGNLNADPRRRRRLRGGLRRARRHRRAGLPPRRGRRPRTPCWCSAPGRSASPSSRWRGRAAPPSMPPTSPTSGWRRPPTSAPCRSPAATVCSSGCSK